MKIKLLVVSICCLAFSGCYTMIDPPRDQMISELDSLDILNMGPGNVEGDYIVNFYNDEYNSYDRYYQDPRHLRYNSWRQNYYWDPYYYNDRYYDRNWRWYGGRYVRGHHGHSGGGGWKPPKIKKPRREDNPHRRPSPPEKDGDASGPAPQAGQKTHAGQSSQPKPPESGRDDSQPSKSETVSAKVEQPKNSPDHNRAEQVKNPDKNRDQSLSTRQVPRPVPEGKEKRAENVEKDEKKPRRIDP